MAIFVFKLPDVGEGIAESEIAQWRVAVGDVVEEDQPLVDMLTDKAAVEIPSPVAGTIRELRGQAGDKIPVGGPLVVLETAAAVTQTDKGQAPPRVHPAPNAAPAAAQNVALSATQSAAQNAGPSATPSVRADPNAAPSAPRSAQEGETPAAASARPATTVAAAPTVRKRARELGIDLAKVEGSGPSGRVLREDLERHASPPETAPAATPAARAGRGGDDDDAIETLRFIGLRRKIGEAMQRSTQRIPHFTYVEEVDTTEIEALRRHLNGAHEDRPRLSLLPFLIRALVRAIAVFPQVNARFDDDAGVVTRYRALHAGIATQTPNGLVVPVVKHAQTLDLWAAAAAIKRLSTAAREGKATRDELLGSTLTITSLGALGGIVTTPVINAPEVAIIGVNKMVERPVVRNGQVVVRSVMNLSSSFDHRIVDGYDAAQFIQKVKALLEHPALLFMPE